MPTHPSDENYLICIIFTGGSIAHTCSLSGESRRSDSCDTEGNVEAIRSESDEPMAVNAGRMCSNYQMLFDYSARPLLLSYRKRT